MLNFCRNAKHCRPVKFGSDVWFVHQLWLESCMQKSILIIRFQDCQFRISVVVVVAGDNVTIAIDGVNAGVMVIVYIVSVTIIISVVSVINIIIIIIVIVVVVVVIVIIIIIIIIISELHKFDRLVTLETRLVRSC